MAVSVLSAEIIGATVDLDLPITITAAGTNSIDVPLTFTCKAGYQFTARGQIMRYNKHKTTGALTSPYSYTMSDLPKTTQIAKVLINQYTDSDYHFIVKPENLLNEFALTTDLTGLALNVEGTVLTGGMNYINVSLLEGYTWYRNDPLKEMWVSYTMNGVTTTVRPTVQDSVNKFVLLEINVTGDVLIKGVAHLREVPTDVGINFNLTNATTTYDVPTIPVGSQTITFNANEGYEFRGIAEIYYDGTVDPVLFYPTGESYQLALNVETGKAITIVLSAFLKVESLGNFTNLFKTNQTELGELSLERFKDIAGVDPEYDYGQMIMNIIEIPFVIPTSMNADIVNIPLGRYVTNVTSQLLNSYRLVIELGSIKVDGIHDNVLDYVNTTIYLHLPYTERIELPIEYVMDETIDIQYVVDLYSGECNIVVHSSLGGGVIAYNDIVPMFNKIPFIQFHTNRTNSKTGLLLDNGLRKAHIEIVRNIPVVNDTGLNTSRNQKLVNVTGYVELDHINLVSSASVNEQREIETTLRNGVFING